MTLLVKKTYPNKLTITRITTCIVICKTIFDTVGRQGYPGERWEKAKEVDHLVGKAT